MTLSMSFGLGILPCSTTMTMPVLKFFCAWSTAGSLGPSAAHWDQFSQYEEVRHFGGRDEAHQVKIEI